MSDEADRASAVERARVNQQIASALRREAARAKIRARAAVAAALVAVSRAKTLQR